MQLSIIDEIIGQFRKNFTLTVEELGHFLGMDIYYNQSSGIMELSLFHYIQSLLTKYAVYLPHVNKSRNSPMDQDGQKLSSTMCPQTDKDLHAMSLLPYRNIVGALIFAAVTTRVDIAYAVNKCAQFMANPGRNHWDALINILVYLRTHPDLVIKYSRPTDPQYLNVLSFFVDSDHGGDVDTSRSTAGYVGLFNNGPICYSSKQQEISCGSGTAQSEL